MKILIGFALILSIGFSFGIMSKGHPFLSFSVSENVTRSIGFLEHIGHLEDLICSSQARNVYFYFENSTFVQNSSISAILKYFYKDEKCGITING